MQGTHKHMSCLNSDQEEADTKLILHAVDATESGATSIDICCPDTDVLVLSLRRYPELCKATSFITGSGKNHRVIPLKPVLEALGSAKIAALPAFHALSGADNTDSFAGKGKLTCWKAFNKTSEDIILALSQLGTTQVPSKETLAAIERFFCQLYQPGSGISKVS